MISKVLNILSRSVFQNKIPSINPNYISHPDLVLEREVCVGIPRSETQSRREKVGELMENESVLFLQSPSLQYISSGVINPWRQSSNLYYLTGCCEPSSLLLMTKDKEGKINERIFVNDSGKGDLLLTNCMGLELSKQIYGVEHTHAMDEFEEIWNMEMESYLENQEIKPILYGEGGIRGEQYVNKDANRDLIQKIRKIKSKNEIELIRTAMDITTVSFNQTLRKHLRPEMTEFELQTLLEMEFKMRGSPRGSSFIPVIASGVNSTYIHYIYNNQIMNDGELVIIDAGVDYYMYITDITRTWPVNGIFSDPQKDVYEAVLETNKKLIEHLKINETTLISSSSSNDLDKLGIEILVNECLEKGIFKNISQHDAELEWRRFQNHSVSHFMGIDIHEEEIILLSEEEDGCVLFTIEPGLYFSLDQDYSNLGLDEKYIGIGVRIEDDLLMDSKNGDIEILSIDIPKEIEEIENMMNE